VLTARKPKLPEEKTTHERNDETVEHGAQIVCSTHILQFGYEHPVTDETMP
jgi:hypothetical protein